MSPSRTLMVVLLVSSLGCLAARDARAEPAHPAQVLVAETLPSSPLGLAAESGSAAALPPGAIATAFIPELDPGLLWPRAGDVVALAPGRDLRFEAKDCPEGDLAPGGGRAYLVAFYVRVERFGDVTVSAEGPGIIRLFVDGLEVRHDGALDDATTRLADTRAWRTGMHRVLLRVEAREYGLLRLAVDAAGAGRGLAFALDPVAPPADYDGLRVIDGISGLVLSHDGRLLAARRFHRDLAGEGNENRLDVLDLANGRAVAAGLLGPGAIALEFAADDSVLLLRKGGSLWLWSRADGRLEPLLDDEPGLGAVRLAPDASFVVFASTRGAEDKGGIRPRTELRARLSDWPTLPHLHLMMTASGARTRLLPPGDWSQDAFAITPDGRSLVYLRSIPIANRPWFATEVHVLDLDNGADRLVTTLRMGFENRPGLAGMELAPDGRTLAFVGPPGELGDAAAKERNAFDPDLWVLDLQSAALTNLVDALPMAAEGHLHWSDDASRLWFLGTQGSRQLVFEATRFEDGRWGVEATGRTGSVEAVSDVAYSANAEHVALVGSRTDDLPALHVDGAVFLDPLGATRARIELATPRDVTVEAEDGTPLETWLYLPGARAPRPADGKFPLVVYYYGGATPTLRGFNELHQFLVANGYALLVTNPRGAAGYGAEFADSHAADWGTRAGADVLRAVDAALATHPELDGARVGCYGGSFGGFMTMWLVSHSDRFAAAVSLYGISDIASYFGDGQWGWTYGDQALARTYPWNAPDWYAEHSPLYHADRIHTPLLLLHGEADTNVPIGESEQMFTALRLLGRPAELVRFPGEDHGLRGTFANRVLHRTMLLDWFDKYLKEQPEAWESRR